MVQHKYSTALLIFLIAILTLAMISIGIDNDDIDELCANKSMIIRKINDQWVCTQAYHAEAYYHSYTQTVLVDLAASNTYYNVTNYTISNIYGLSYDSNGLLITRNGTYHITLQMAMQGGVGGDYEFELFKSGVAQPDCSTFVTTSGTDHINVVISCLKTVETGDYLIVAVKDLSAPAKDIQYHQLNFMMHELL